MLETQTGGFQVIGTFAPVDTGQTLQLLGIIPLLNPVQANWRQPLPHIDGHIRVSVGARGIVDGNRRVILELSVCQRGRTLANFSHGDTNVRARAGNINFLRTGDRLAGFINGFSGDGALIVWHVGLQNTWEKTGMADTIRQRLSAKQPRHRCDRNRINFLYQPVL